MIVTKYLTLPMWMRSKQLELLPITLEEFNNNWSNSQMLRIQEGDKVINQDSLEGVVLPASAYGDQPYQIHDEDGQYHCYINCDGSSEVNNDVWELKNF